MVRYTCLLSYIVDMLITVMTFMSLFNIISKYSLVISRPTGYSIKYPTTTTTQSSDLCTHKIIGKSDFSK